MMPGADWKAALSESLPKYSCIAFWNVSSSFGGINSVGIWDPAAFIGLAEAWLEFVQEEVALLNCPSLRGGLFRELFWYEFLPTC